MRINLPLNSFLFPKKLFHKNKQLEVIPPIFLHVEQAGTLTHLINDSKKHRISSLTLSGNINGADLRLIREMAGSDYCGKPTEGSLRELDLSRVKIVEGGGHYYRESKFYFSKDNEIGYHMFGNCKKLNTIILPEDIISIDNLAFKGCIGLSSIHLPAAVTTIGGGAFCECRNLESFTVSAGNRFFTSHDGILFDKEEKCLVVYPIAKGNCYRIPDNVTSLGEWAFRDSELCSVIIPNTVVSINNCTFKGCKKLKGIHIRCLTPLIISNCLFDCIDKSKCVLYVPKGSYLFYWIAEGWGEFKNIVEEEDIECPKIV